MSEKGNDSTLLKITAPSDWWKESLGLLSVSSEKSNDSSESTSFLACTFIDVDEENGHETPSMHTESDVSTTFVTLVHDDVELEGGGRFLIKTSSFLSVINNMPSGEDVTACFEENSVVFVSGDEKVEFTLPLESITNIDAVPYANNEFIESAFIAKCNPKDLISAYKLGSSMSKPKDSDASSGYDPLSGCLITIDGKGVSMLTASNSAAESYIECKDIDKGDSEAQRVQSLTFPEYVIPRLSKFSLSEEVSVGIGEDGYVHIRDDNDSHMVISPINTGRMNSKLSYKLIMGVAKPVWDSRSVTVNVPASELSSALSRAKSVKADALLMEVSNTSIKVSEKKGTSQYPFSQKISCSTKWHDDGEHFVEVNVLLRIIDKIFTMSTENGSFIFDIAFKKDGSPWAIIVHTGDKYDQDNPHNFFVVNAQSSA